MNKKKLKILLISPLPPPVGGIATWTKQYIEWSYMNNLEVDVVDTSLIGKRARKNSNKINILEEIIRTVKIIKNLNNKINEFKPEVIHLNTACGKFGIIRDFICAKIVKKKKIKLIVHYRCNIEDQLDHNIFSKKFFQKISNKADINLLLNNSSLKFIKLYSNKKTFLIPNFINTDFITKESKVIKKEIDNISFVGHVTKSKGILEIIQTARQMPEITFKIAGPVDSKIRKIKKPSNLVYLGAISKEEVRKLLLESDVFLFPTYTEGFANVMLEAMAISLPIITTSVGSNLDMIEDKGGIIVEVGSVSDIVEAINCIRNSKKRSEMSKWNLTKIRNNYTIDQVMKDLLHIYELEL